MITHSLEETLNAAKGLAKKLKPGSVVALSGNLGSGKTSFVKGLALGLGMKNKDGVTSPTFTIMHQYPTHPPLYHFDLYRMDTAKDLESIGFEEFITDGAAISCVEWAEKAKALLPADTLWVHFENCGENKRRIEWNAKNLKR